MALLLWHITNAIIWLLLCLPIAVLQACGLFPIIELELVIVTMFLEVAAIVTSKAFFFWS